MFDSFGKAVKKAYDEAKKEAEAKVAKEKEDQQKLAEQIIKDSQIIAVNMTQFAEKQQKIVDNLFGTSKDNIAANSRAHERFASGSPILLCVIEYLDEAGGLIGSLLAWDRYIAKDYYEQSGKQIEIVLEATHYEIFKRNVFAENEDYNRIMFVDKKTLLEETKNYIPYLEKTLGLDVKDEDIIIVLDKTIKKDRIYDYKVKATLIPQTYRDIYYDIILRSRDRIRGNRVDSKSNLADIANAKLGSYVYTWILSLVNPNISYFDTGLMLKGVETGLLNIPENIIDITTIINESATMFGAKNTFENIGYLLGSRNEQGGPSLTLEYKMFLDAIDEKSFYFSKTNYDSITSNNGIKNRIDLKTDKYLLNINDLSEVMKSLFNFAVENQLNADNYGQSSNYYIPPPPESVQKAEFEKSQKDKQTQKTEQPPQQPQSSEGANQPPLQQSQQTSQGTGQASSFGMRGGGFSSR
jgi:hypothetical protein